MIQLEIVTPDGVKLAREVAELTAPSVDGEFGVLPSHRPMLAALTTGIVTYKIENQSESVAVGSGFVEIADDRAVVLTDRFIRKEDIDPVRVRLDLKEADEALEKFDDDPNSPEYGELIARELWAAAQLELYGDPPPPRMRTMTELQFGSHESYSDIAKEAEGDPNAETSEH